MEPSFPYGVHKVLPWLVSDHLHPLVASSHVSYRLPTRQMCRALLTEFMRIVGKAASEAATVEQMKAQHMPILRKIKEKP